MPILSLREFEDAIGHILDQLGTPLQPARLVLMLDEMDETIGHDWTQALYNQLRALVYSGDLKHQIRLVLTGSKGFLDAMNDRGSPLWNILKIHHLPSLSQTETELLMSRAEGLSDEAALAVWEHSGGHPFLAQYLLYYLWEAGISPSSAMTVADVANLFLSERRAYIETWAKTIGVIGLKVYDQLANHSKWLDETEIIKAVGEQNAPVKDGLDALYYHGLIEHDGSWQRYRRTGDIFRDWYAENGLQFIEALSVKEIEL